MRLYKLLASILIACCCVNAHARQKLRVYFIGNSYIYTNNLPQMIKDVAASMGDTLVFEEHDPGGWSLIDHWDIPPEPCIDKIKSNNWDYVVLQEQSQKPSFPWPAGYWATYAYAKNFTQLIRDSTTCTHTMLYMTWGRKNGDAATCASLSGPPYNWPYTCTYKSMDSIIRVRYMEMADSFNASVSPVGAVRNYIRQHYAGIELYDPDESHPSLAGTYAAACAFYTVLFRKDPTLITYNSSLNTTDAANIKTSAKKVAYESLSYWQLDPTVLFPNFRIKYQAGDSIAFTNTSTNAVSFLWNFGDGTTSTLLDPGHKYTAGGTYTVSLRITNAKGCSRTLYETVNINPSSVAALYGIDDISVTPNPAHNSITLSSKQLVQHNCRLVITGIDGKTLYDHTKAGVEKQVIDITPLNAGVYFLTLYANGACVYNTRFVKN